MNWIKQNTFEAVLLLVVLVAAIGIFLFGKSQRSAYEESLESFEDADRQVSQLENVAPYPNNKNVEDRRKEVSGYRGEVEGLQKSLLGFRPAEFKKTSPAAFTSRLNETSARLKSLYGEKITYPEEWQLGFEAYTASPPRDQATAFLGFQLGAMEWLFTELAKARPTALLNVSRPQLPIEKGQPMQKKNGATKPYYVLPVEISFSGREASMRKFLSALAGSEDYFVTVRSMRITNSETGAPSEDDAEFEEDAAAPAGGAGAFDAFEGFDFGVEEEEEEPEEAAPEGEDVETGNRILGQVLGAEELNVFLHLEILLFRDDVKLPAVGK